jgi:hypothetical protein
MISSYVKVISFSITSSVRYAIVLSLICTDGSKLPLVLFMNFVLSLISPFCAFLLIVIVLPYVFLPLLRMFFYYLVSLVPQYSLHKTLPWCFLFILCSIPDFTLCHVICTAPLFPFVTFLIKTYAGPCLCSPLVSTSPSTQSRTFIPESISVANGRKWYLDDSLL